MVDVVVHEDVFEDSKIHAAIIEKIRQEMISNPSGTRPRLGGKKWEEIVRLNGAKYAVVCRWEGDKVMMIRARKSPTRKFRIRK
jgi:hypothetical protein